MQLFHTRPVVSAVFDEPNLVSAAGLRQPSSPCLSGFFLAFPFSCFPGSLSRAVVSPPSPFGMAVQWVASAMVLMEDLAQARPRHPGWAGGVRWS